jgi:hypothetical protein
VSEETRIQTAADWSRLPPPTERGGMPTNHRWGRTVEQESSPPISVEQNVRYCAFWAL